MKISEILPEVPQFMQTEKRMTAITDALSLTKSYDNVETYRSPTIGLDQVVNTWLRQQIAYRQQLVIDLSTLGMILEEVRSPIIHLVSEVFRRGIQWKPKFSYKCKICEAEYDQYGEMCDQCQEMESLFKPDPMQKKLLEPFFKEANAFNNTLEEVLRETWFDVNVIDDGFLFLGKEYIGSDDLNEAVRSKVIEVQHLHPALVEYDLDKSGLPKNSHFICYLHRDDSPAATEPGFCPDCERELMPAMYAYHDANRHIRYLLESEVCHISKFRPSATYGWSPLLTLYEKVLTLIGMDKNLYRYFYERRMPPSMVMVFTDDPESLRREREHIAAQTRIDPNYIPMIAVSARQNRGRVENVRFFHSLQEMDYLPVRQEIRERIASMWGVTPMWQGAPEAYGGLSSQTPQLIVTSRVVEGDQRIFAEKVFPWLLDAFGITDWELTLPQPEEKAEATRISFAQQRASIANMVFSMGFNVEIVSDGVSIENIDFKVSGKAQRPEDAYGGEEGGAEAGGAFAGGVEDIPGGEEDEVGAEENLSPAQKMVKMDKSPLYGIAKGWVEQINQSGHRFPVIKSVSNDGNIIKFQSEGNSYVARFNGSDMTGIEKDVVSPRMHTHKGYPPHDSNMPHNDNRKTPDKDTNLFDIEEPDGPDDLSKEDLSELLTNYDN